MNVVVAVLDHDDWNGLADVIVWVQPEAKRLTWIPRDLWSPLLGNRINTAVAAGRSEHLREALRDLDFPCESVLCLRRGATEAVLRDAAITVPIPEMLAFWCASADDRNIAKGRRFVAFAPPEETLQGERIHQWLGARYMVNGAKSDLHRLHRQQVLLRATLESAFDFAAALADPERYEIVGADPMPVLARVDATWTLSTFLAVVPETIDGKAVLVRTGARPGLAGG